MSDYKHHIFISYRRMDQEWITWTRENFIRPLRSLLQPALGSVNIFADDLIETGVSWPAYIAAAHARSRLMVPILSRDYFNSDWCRLELALMLYREKSVGFRTASQENVLILPVIIDDGDSFPLEVQDMQGEKIHRFANPFMSANGARQEEFAAHLQQWCPRIEKALQTVPPYNPSWQELAHNQFRNMFEVKVAAQKTVPALSLAPLSSEGSQL